MSIYEDVQDGTPENNDVREHRLGVRGKLGLPKALAKSASDHGLDVKATRFQNRYTITAANGKPVASILPMLADKVGAIRREDLGAALSHLHQPLRHIARNITEADYEVDIDSVIDAENEMRKRPEFLASSPSFAAGIDPSIEYKLANTKETIVSNDANSLHDNLYRAIGFVSRASVKEEELHNGGHGDYDDHDDGCEVVAEDLEKAEAKKNASETSGLLLEGLRFSRKNGQYRLAVHEDFASGAFEGNAQQQLHLVLKDALDKAKPEIQWNKKPSKIYLSAIELERFCKGVYDHTQSANADFEFAIEDVLLEEVSAEDFENVDAKAEALQQSETLSQLAQLNPDKTASTQKRIAELSTALTTLQVLVDNPDMQGIWKKYNVTGRFFQSEDNPLAALCADLERMQRVIDRNITGGSTSLADLEAITAEFRDTIAGGREIISILDKALNNTSVVRDGADATTMHFNHLDKMLANASLAPTTLPRNAMDEHAKEIAHYVGRHTGQEGVDIPEAIEDFVDDFGGEVVEFVKKNKILTTALGLTFYFTMNAAAAQGGDVAQDLVNVQDGILGAGGAGFDSTASITDLLGNTQSTFTPMSIDEQERQYGSQAIEVCHLHLPIKIPYFEHCLVSDQAVHQLQSGYELIKGPLSTVLDAPADGVDILAPRAEGEPPVHFVDNFKSSLRSTGDVWFVANGYQNLAHAPWAAVAGTMGYKLGAIPAIRKTSGLITPLIDGAYGLTADNKFLLSNIPAIGYGYDAQGVSGAVMASTIASLGSYGAQSAQRGSQKAMELLPHSLKNHLPKNMRYGALTSSKIIKLSDYSVNDNVQTQGGGAGYERNSSGLFLPSPKGLAGKAATPIENPVSLAQPFQALPDELNSKLTLTIAGRTNEFDLNSETYADLVKSLSEFKFLLEHVPEKLGVVEEEPEYETEKDRLEAEHKIEQLDAVKSRLAVDRNRKSKVTDFEYDDYLKRNIDACLDALEDYRKGDISTQVLESVLSKKTDTVLAAKIVHLSQSGEKLEPQQERALAIKGHQTARLFARESARKDDRDALAQTAFNAGRSIAHIKEHPIATPISLGLKATSAAVTLGKMSIRNTWSAARDDIVPAAQLGWNAIPPKTKGHIIGAGMAVTALAMKVDMDPQFSQIIQDNLPNGGETLTDGFQEYSGAVGNVAGATTATGLFMVYNFGEDHLIIHITMGYACIIGGAGARVAAYPLSKGAQIAEVFAEEIADMSKGYLDARKPGRAAKKGLNHLQRLSRDVRNYDQVYLPSLDVT